jgi:hypothetical protein
LIGLPLETFENGNLSHVRTGRQPHPHPPPEPGSGGRCVRRATGGRMSPAATTPEAPPRTASAVHARAPGHMNLPPAHAGRADLDMPAPCRGRARGKRGAVARGGNAAACRGRATAPRRLHQQTEALRDTSGASGMHGIRPTGAGMPGAGAALCRTGTAAAAGRRAVHATARVGAVSVAATVLIPASTPSQDHKKRGSR